MNKIYLIKCYSKERDFVKLGYTSTSIKRRFKDFKYKWKVIRVVKHKDAELIETAIHRLLRKDRVVFSDRFSGHTECYSLEKINHIHKLINDLCGIKPKFKKKRVSLYRRKHEVMNNRGQLDWMDLSMYRK